MHKSLPDFLLNPNPEIYLGDNYVVLDLETSNHEKGSALDERNFIVLAHWRLGASHRLRHTGRDHSAWADEFGQSELLTACASADFLVAHNTKFELGWLKRAGIDLRKVIPYDTMIGEKVLAGNRKKKLSLEGTAARRGLDHKNTTASLLIEAEVPTTDIPESMLAAYCKQDVALTEQIFLAQRIELKELALLPVFYVRNVTTPALADIEFNGMTLDPARVHETFTEYAMKYGELAEEFARITDGVNPKSGKQMRELIYGTTGTLADGTPVKHGLWFEELTDFRGAFVRTAKGQAKTDKHTLAKLKAKTPDQRKFLKVAKELMKFKTPLQNLTKMHEIAKANPKDPRVYAVYNQTVVQTDRLSSTGRRGGFQFHNFDRAFKKLFRARQAGWIIGEADAPQLEFRVATYLGHDPVAKRDIQEGVDVHAISASTLGVDRQAAKPFTFKPLYGGNSGTPRQRKYYGYFRERYSGIYRTQERWTMDVVRDKFLVTPWGLRFYWGDAEVTKSGYITNTTQIFNYPIQSFATADIIPLVLVMIWHRVAHLEEMLRLVNTIHDSVVAELDPRVRAEYTRIVVECFTEDIYELLQSIYGIEFDVPLGVGLKFSSHWADTKDEQKIESKLFKST